MQPSIPWSSSASVFVIERTAIIHSLKCTVPFSLVVPLLSFTATHYYFLSLFVTRCITRCHSLSLVAPLVVPLVVTRCHSLSLVVTGCTTLPFYKRSYTNIKKTLNRPIAKFYHGDDVNVFAAESRLTKTRLTSFYKKHNLL